MEKLSNLLVVLDPTSEEQKALLRAIEFSQKHPCKLTVFLSIYDFSYEMTTMLSSDERESMRQAVITDREEWIHELFSTLSVDPSEIDIKVVWHNRPYEAIIEQVKEHGYNLVVKGTHQHDTLKSVIFTPTDWNILRKCPCPVLLVKEHAWPANGNILAAVNAGSEEDAHQSLNSKIIEEAQHLADIIGAKVHLVNSYPGTPVNIAIEIPEFDPQEYNASMKHHHISAVEKLATLNNIPIENTHVVEGLPEDVIPHVSKQIDAELVVMGTIGRTGLSAALIGNTAEHVIDSLHCDVLALKPVGYNT
ncbi:universal stress protein UspE [Flocculibacter collagenilyticus]|uniref:universal stress protein UspE n=1 Tax=Flocculibacter collagenilyticus TaxID=2744479 RepID=UPI0018F434B8|nr:universal stress protein UspE [Flocculibacter collagenilyticus]